jgi:predicted nucleotidyltransferase
MARVRAFGTLAKGVRKLSVFAPVASAARTAYGAAASVMARALGDVPGVDGVYLLGSLTRPEFVQPGKSDIDLVVAARLPTLEAELEVRERLHRIHRCVHALIPLFNNLDYFDVDDLDCIRRFANAWTLDLDVRWKCVAGTNRLASPYARPRPERRVELCAMALKRWMKAGTRLLAAGPADDQVFLRGIAERLLMDTLAAYLDGERLTRLEWLVETASASLPLASLRDVVPPSRREPERLLLATLEVLEALARETTADWNDAWKCSGTSAPLEPRPEIARTAQRFVEAGFSGVVGVRRGSEPSDAVFFAAAPPEWTAARALAVTREVQRRTPALPTAVSAWLSRPVLLTAPLLQAAALLSPSPFVGAELAARPSFLAGAEPSPPKAPPAAVVRAILRTRVAMSFIRRHVRTRWARPGWSSHFEYDVAGLCPALSRAQDEERVPLSWSRAPLVGERALVAAQRAFVIERKGVLARDSNDAPALRPEPGA